MSPQTASTAAVATIGQPPNMPSESQGRLSPEARWRLLSEVGDALNARLDGASVLAELARRCVPGLADYCVTYLLDESQGSVIRGGVAHAEPEGEALVRRLLTLKPPKLADAAGAGAVVRTGQSILVRSISTDLLEQVAHGEHLAILRELGPISSMVLPLTARGHTVGAIAFATTNRSGRVYDEHDLELASELAVRAALALDNARLFESACNELARRRQAEDTLRQRYAQLRAVYAMSETVSRADRVEDIYEQAIEGLCGATRATRASILLFDPDGVMRFKAWRGLSGPYRAQAEGHSPWTQETVDAQPIAFEDVASAPLGDELRATVLAEGIRALVFVPLVYAQRLLGKLMLYFPEPRTIPDDDVELALAVARSVSVAIVRVRDDARLRTALDATERANVAKSQFLGVMSHELRTPLNSVMGYSDLLLVEAKGPLNEAQRGYVRRIQASAKHQLALIDEILTYARLEAGREDLNRMETDVRRVALDVAEFIRPEAESKGLQVCCQIPADPVVAYTDPVKLRQVVLNLAANATKFTRRGEVALRLVVSDDDVVIAVHDTGDGIPPEERERIWEPFVQGGSVDAGRQPGTGLGLTIVRRLVTLLGGQIAFESQLGGGTVFTVRVPRSGGWSP